MEFQKGDRVHFSDPGGAGEVEGRFLQIADPDEAIEVPVEDERTRKADAAWVELEDGTTALVVYSRLRPA